MASIQQGEPAPCLLLKWRHSDQVAAGREPYPHARVGPQAVVGQGPQNPRGCLAVQAMEDQVALLEGRAILLALQPAWLPELKPGCLPEERHQRTLLKPQPVPLPRHR